jgi:hypothetical protein
MNSFDPAGLPLAVRLRRIAISSGSSAVPDSRRQSSALISAAQYLRSSLAVGSSSAKCALALEHPSQEKLETRSLSRVI